MLWGPDSEALRRAIGEAFARVATKQLEFPRAGCEPPYDPVRWDPVDWSVVVVRPNDSLRLALSTRADFGPFGVWRIVCESRTTE